MVIKLINKSIWLKDCENSTKNSLNSSIKTDILIIGGGITGLSCAYFLKDYDVTLIERNFLGCGATSKSTGKINYLQDLLINKNKNIEDLYLKSQLEACKLVRDIVKENNIDCNYEENSSYLYATNQSDINKIKKIEKILARNNIKYEIENNNFFQDNIYSIKVNDTAVFNPYKYLQGLKKILENKIKIYENSNATDYKVKDNKIVVKVNNYEVICNKLIIATGYPFKVKAGLVPFKTSVYKSYITASKTKENKKFNAISYDNMNSYRFYTDNNANYLITSFDYAKIGNYNNIDSFNKNINIVKEKYGTSCDYFWSNYDISSSDKIPLAGLLKDNIYVLSSYSSWGMTNATISSKIVTDNIKKIDNCYTELFNPNRFTKIVNIVGDNFSNAKSFISSKLKKLETKKAITFKEKNVKYGAYNDGKKIHIVYNTCPHMKCSLKFNKIDKVWECPCHSSVFDIDGNIVKGPANYSIKVEN